MPHLRVGATSGLACPSSVVVTLAVILHHCHQRYPSTTAGSYGLTRPLRVVMAHRRISSTPNGSPFVVPDTMKAAGVDRFGPPSALTLHEVPVPRPGPQEVLIAIDTAGVGSWDASIRDGSWRKPGRTRFPLVPGVDGSGVVVAKGARVRRADFRRVGCRRHDGGSIRRSKRSARHRDRLRGRGGPSGPKAGRSSCDRRAAREIPRATQEVCARRTGWCVCACRRRGARAVSRLHAAQGTRRLPERDRSGSQRAADVPRACLRCSRESA
jgi:hypothetical protein